MEKLSVVIITLNEERNLGRCLESVRSLADEILVVDSCSADRTAEIARSFGARIIEQPFLGHIEQKNFAADHATHNWVLSLDADEALSPELEDSIRKALANPAVDAYKMNRLTNYCGKWVRHSGWYPDRKARLWDRRKGRWGGQNPHDKWELSSGTDYGKLRGDLLHYSYYTLSEHLKQIEKFTEIAARASVREGKDCSVFKVVFGGCWKFIHSYIIKLGFLDGYTGFLVCSFSAYSSFAKYAKIRQYNRSDTR